MRNAALVVGVAVIAALAAYALSATSFATGDAAAPPPQGEVKVAGPGEPTEVKPPQPVDMKKVSYIIGMGMGKQAKQVDIALDTDELLAGLKDGMAGAKPRFTDAEVQKIMTAFQEGLTAQQEAKVKKMAEEAKVKGAAYLAENAKKDGVKTTASGLQYRVIKAGAATGKQPKVGNSVTVDYKGRLIDGTVFDSSYERGKPVTFEVGRVIEGWNEALKLMHEGDTWELTIPSGLGYGEDGNGPIPPNSVLVFEVDLQKVEAAPATDTPKPMPK